MWEPWLSILYYIVVCLYLSQCGCTTGMMLWFFFFLIKNKISTNYKLGSVIALLHFQMLDSTGIANWSVTHVDWSEGKWHPKSYTSRDVTYELMKNITVWPALPYLSYRSCTLNFLFSHSLYLGCSYCCTCGILCSLAFIKSLIHNFVFWHLYQEFSFYWWNKCINNLWILDLKWFCAI